MRAIAWCGRAAVALALVSSGLWWSGSVFAANVEIVIDQLAFAPAEARAKVGDTVEWDNRDVVAHTATDTHGEWRIEIAPGKRARLVLKKAGTVDYFCEYHPNMTGRLVVLPAAEHIGARHARMVRSALARSFDDRSSKWRRSSRGEPPERADSERRAR